ncbi:hypothetical protein [Paraburkholderia strydomiana]|uniref:hypothetical protein n=1 Tax=Paraburkholderia strydomiana TaxID=1245417 RepID=UPI001BEA985C|nr:hypothetical protein [Paraburkholderia strydomiana]MBT2793864.1 hypothetical protein [Paraburkholderia strydomiana]
MVSLFGREATRAARQLSLFSDGDECLDFRHSFVIQGVNAVVRASFAKLFGVGMHIANAMFPGPASFLTSECQCRRGSDLIDRLKEELLALKRILDAAVMLTAKEFV